MSQDRRIVNAAGSWKPWLRLILALGWLLLATRISFQRRAPKPPRRPGEPAIWKLVVWMILFVALFSATWILPKLLNGG